MDILNKKQRSKRMSRVCSKGNRSTEWKFRSKLLTHQISGWVMHNKAILGIPDFFFPERKLAIFIDGCFWHGCPKCLRPLPKTNRHYWAKKIKSNIDRKRFVSRKLRHQGIRVCRIWEHDLRSRNNCNKIFRYVLNTYLYQYI